jgi:hypothetical protein
MILRVFLIAAIGWFVYTLYRRLMGAGRRAASGQHPFSRPGRKSKFDGKAVDADFEEIDDNKGGA